MKTMIDILIFLSGFLISSIGINYIRYKLHSPKVVRNKDTTKQAIEHWLQYMNKKAMKYHYRFENNIFKDYCHIKQCNIGDSNCINCQDCLSHDIVNCAIICARLETVLELNRMRIAKKFEDDDFDINNHEI